MASYSYGIGSSPINLPFDFKHTKRNPFGGGYNSPLDPPLPEQTSDVPPTGMPTFKTSVEAQTPYQTPSKDDFLSMFDTGVKNVMNSGIQKNTRLEALRNLGTPDTDAYRGYLRQLPQRQDYQLSKIGKLLAGVSGTAHGYNTNVASGVDLGLGLMDRPYNRALQDYGTKGGMLKELAGMEQSSNKQKTELEVALNEAEIKRMDAFNKALDTIGLTGKRRADILDEADQAAARGYDTHIDTSTGHMWRVNKKDPTDRTDMGKLDASYEEKKATDYGFDRKLVYDRLNADNAHTEFVNAQPDPQKAEQAWKAGMDYAIENNGDLVKGLLIQNDKGDWVLDPKQKDSANYKALVEKAKQAANMFRGRVAAEGGQLFPNAGPTPPLIRTTGPNGEPQMVDVTKDPDWKLFVQELTKKKGEAQAAQLLSDPNFIAPALRDFKQFLQISNADYAKSQQGPQVQLPSMGMLSQGLMRNPMEGAPGAPNMDMILNPPNLNPFMEWAERQRQKAPFPIGPMPQ